VVLYDLCLAPDVSPASGAGLRALLRSLPLRRYAAYLAVTGLYLVVRAQVIHDVQPTNALDNPLVELAAPLRIVNAFAVAWRYLGLLLLPLKLSYDYSWGALPILDSVWDPIALLATAGVVAVAGLVAWSWRAAPALCFALGFGITTFFIVSNVAVPIGTIMAERLIYLPSVGFCIAAALILRRALAALVSPPRRAQALFALAFALAVAVNGWLTVKRNPDWATDKRLLLSALETQPGSAKVRHNAGSTYLALGELDKAEAEQRLAVSIYPRYGRAHASLGHVLVSQGRPKDAIASYERAGELGWTDARTANNLGFLLIDGNVDLPRGVLLVEAAVREEPDNLSYVDSLGWAYFRQGRLQEALPLLERAVAGAKADVEATVRRQHLQDVQRALAALAEAEEGDEGGG
jgi:tetratricopeptide (TPR) repeat protein